MTTAYSYASIDDNLGFGTLINGLGGQSLYRALYGQYNFTSLVELCYLSISAKSSEGILGAFASFNDGFTSDSDSFDEIIAQLSEFIPNLSVFNYFMSS
jgi:hypothetical protein